MSEKSSTAVFQPVEPVRKTSRLPRIFSLLLGLSAFYAIFSLISIELKGRASRVKSRDEWSSLFVSHPYVPSTSGDARSPCPALNTLANHGFIPHDGRNITPNQLFDAIVKIGLNPLPSHGIIGLAFSQLQLAKPDDHFWTQFTSLKTLDLDRLTVYGVLEHDVSLSRNDTALTNSTSRVNPDYVERMIKSASGGVFTRQNEHDFRKTRWLESLRDNKRLNLKLLDQIASAAECSLLMELLGRNGAISTDHLKSFLLEERIPDDWYPQETSLLSFGSSVVKCLYGVRHSKATLH